MSVISANSPKEIAYVEKLTIELPADVLAHLRIEARNYGQSPEELAADRVVTPFLRARAEAQAVLNGRFRPLEDAVAEMQAKYGMEDLSQLTPDELGERMEEALADVPAEKIAEAKRLGLL